MSKPVHRRASDVANHVFRRRGHVAFILKLKPGSKMLDVGCGSNSPLRYKRLRPDIHYTGLDIGDYHQNDLSISAADEYVLVGPENFSGEIEKYEKRLDAVISSHNLEHCNDSEAVLRAMARSLKPGGRMYLSFPCEDSIGFPSRSGTLNFYDDETHNYMPKFRDVCSALEAQGLEIDFAAQRYRPLALLVAGLLSEPISRFYNRLAPFGATWAFYGFETVIWATCPEGSKSRQQCIENTHGDSLYLNLSAFI